VIDALGPRGAQAVTKHLANCEACRDHVVSLCVESGMFDRLVGAEDRMIGIYRRGGSALCGVAGFQHHLGPWVPVLGGIGWIIASDNLSYLLRHRYGARIANLLSRQPPRTRLRRRLITWLHALTRDRRAGSALSYPKFALFNAAHALPWAALFVEAGYLLTGYWHSTHLGRTTRVATVVAAALVLVAAWSARRRRRCQRAQSQSG
jgi:membrane protein DedA with SNARE-associated domain